jgi:hypothetical protein
MYARIGAIALAIALALPGLAGAQVTSTGSIQVVVEDAQGGRLPGVTVTARAEDSVTTRTTVTDAEGVAVLEAMAPSRNYVITAALQGFTTRTVERVQVTSGQTTAVPTTLAVGGLTEQVTVTAVTPAVDFTTALVGQEITLDVTERLPTGRSYQSYLQLVPGVLPDDPVLSGNPAARSGVNYSDIRGEMNKTADNVYYFDGINVTDPVTGTFGANLNTEIIQEQKVLTGGIPAEFVGAASLVSNLITKSGGNTLHGSANYFFQNANLVAENEHGESSEFSTKDNGYTIGGPILRDRAWFFGSYRYTNREDDVVTQDTREFMRTVDNTQHQGFAKATWSLTNSDMVTATYLSDPTDISGRRETSITNARDRSQKQGGHRYALTYQRLWGATTVEGGYNKHNGEVSQLSAIRQKQNNILFQGTDVRTLADEQLGGFGQDLINQRDNEGVRGVVTHTWNNHQIKAGIDWARHLNFRDTLYLDREINDSIAAKYLGANVTAASLASGTWSSLQFDVTNSSDLNGPGGLISTINARPDRARFYAAFDTDGDGTITSEELGTALTFNTVNPSGGIFYDRTFQSATGPQETSSKGFNVFVQDQFTIGDRVTLNLGLRGERWAHYATTGENIFTFPWEWAPRLSAAYDLTGNGRHKASIYWGRYYDPIRNDMTNFAGTLTGSVLEEQVYMLGEWITYRTRGGSTQQDAFFAPTTQTPYTDDLQLNYASDLGRDMSFEALYTNRRTRDIFEDYDLHLYSDPEGYGGPIDHPDSLFLPLSYFGYTSVPPSNFVVATLAGAKRDYHNLEFVFRKRFSDRWQAQGSYTWADAKGNSNSDGNADFQGDVLFLDPRAPNQYSTAPGLVRHLTKGYVSYEFPFGLQLGGVLNWNSGTTASRTFFASSRNLPIRVAPGEAFEFAGITTRWIAPETVGVLANPAYGTVDLRLQYNRTIAGRTVGEVFLDLFNIANSQGAIREQDLVAGQGGNALGSGIQFQTPRRAFVGVRVRF